jgi:hypothetical protein
MVEKGFTPVLIINKLREDELLLQQGATIAAGSERPYRNRFFTWLRLR